MTTTSSGASPDDPRETDAPAPPRRRLPRGAFPTPRSTIEAAPAFDPEHPHPEDPEHPDPAPPD